MNVGIKSPATLFDKAYRHQGEARIPCFISCAVTSNGAVVHTTNLITASGIVPQCESFSDRFYQVSGEQGLVVAYSLPVSGSSTEPWSQSLSLS